MHMGLLFSGPLSFLLFFFFTWFLLPHLSYACMFFDVLKMFLELFQTVFVWHHTAPVYLSLLITLLQKYVIFFSRQNKRPNIISWPWRLCFTLLGQHVNLYCPFMREVPVYLMNQTIKMLHYHFYLYRISCLCFYWTVFYRLERCIMLSHSFFCCFLNSHTVNYHTGILKHCRILDIPVFFSPPLLCFKV